MSLGVGAPLVIAEPHGRRGVLAGCEMRVVLSRRTMLLLRCALEIRAPFGIDVALKSSSVWLKGEGEAICLHPCCVGVADKPIRRGLKPKVYLVKSLGLSRFGSSFVWDSFNLR